MNNTKTTIKHDTFIVLVNWMSMIDENGQRFVIPADIIISIGFDTSNIGTYLFSFWHERVAFQWSAFGRSTAGNDVVATKNNILFFSFFLFSFLFFSPSSTFLIEGVLGSKNLFSKSCLECPKTYG